MVGAMAPYLEPANCLHLLMLVFFIGMSIASYRGILGYCAQKLRRLRYLVAGPQIIDQVYAKVSVLQIFLLPLGSNHPFLAHF